MSRPVVMDPTCAVNPRLNRILAQTRLDGPHSGTGATLEPLESRTLLSLAPVTPVLTGSVWTYLDNGSNQGTVWRERTFDDAAWKTGRAQLGYGDGDEATIVSSGGSPKFITTYFRHAFNLSNAAGVTELSLQLLRDDGAVVYLNGAEVFRSNMPSGTITSTTLASSGISDAAETTWHLSGVNPALLVAGTNVLAVEVHQSSTSSSDVSFDLALTGMASIDVPVAPVAPDGLQATAGSATRIDLTWFDRSDNESGFEIDRSTDPSFATGVVQFNVGANVTSYGDTTASPETTYHYRVRATNSAGDSPNSAPASATTPVLPTLPAAPSSLSATAVSASRIDLAWTDNADDETGVVIERATDSTFTANLVRRTVTGTDLSAFSDTGLSAGTTYHYRVRASNDAGESAPSNTASASTFTVVAFTPIPPGSVWTYLDNGSDQGTAWRSAGFDDSTWKSGAAQLGYGDGDETTVVNSGGSIKFITTYFRRAFNISDPGAVTALQLQLLRDDGAVVYLNGTEVFRSNMPSGTIAHTTGASTGISGGGETTWYAATINPALLVSGTNVLAVEVHQSSSTSSDMSFDLRLDGTRSSGPPVAPVAPANLSAVAVAHDRVNLSWTDTSDVEESIRVERSTAGTDWQTIATVPANATSYVDAGVVPTTTYLYRVVALNGAGASEPGNIASVTTPQRELTSQVTFVSSGSTWRYLDNGSDQGTAWRGTGFDHAAWKLGRAQLGYGDGDEATIVNSGGSTKFITTYFRQSFDVADPALVRNLTVQLLRDDGAVVYINGVEVVRSNMPTGTTITYTTRASSGVSDAAERTWLTFAVDPALLVAGTNVVAVEVHQNSTSSSDMSFDLRLDGTQVGEPTIPAAPTDLLAVPEGEWVNLFWTDSSSDEDGFRIERSTDGIAFEEFVTVGLGVTRVADTTVTPGATYWYQVVALNDAGSSAPSNTVVVTAPADSGIAYTGPIVITAGGTYTGNWQSLDPFMPAVIIRTSEPVVIENSNIRGRGDLIVTDVDNADLTVRNTRGIALNPNIYGQSPGRFLEADFFNNVVVENNSLEGTGGMKLLEFRGDVLAGDTVKILRNAILNIDGRKSNGRGGILDFNKRTRLSDGAVEEGYRIRQFVQLDKVTNVAGIEIGWNQIVNEPGRSRVEDVINIYKSSGTSDSPIRIHDNFIFGAYTVRPWESGIVVDGDYSYDWGYAGGGILLGDGETGVAYVQADHNQVVSTTNHGIAIAAGHDSVFFANRIVSSGRLSDGRWIGAQNVGAYIWDLYNTGPSFYNNSGHDNLIGWINTPEGGHNDWWIPDATSFQNNTAWPDPITLDTEAAEWTVWQEKLTTGGVVVGASTP